MAIRTDIYSIDWSLSPRIININISVTDASAQDLYDTCKHLEALDNGKDEGQICDAGGWEPLDVGFYVGITVSLFDAKYKFADRAGPTWVVCNMKDGNIVAFEDITKAVTIYPREPSTYVSADRTADASGTISEVGGGITEGDKTDIIEGVWDESLVAHIVANSAATAIKAGTYVLGSITLDTVNGTAGTGWPIGTHFKPSDNLTDALLIMFYGNVADLVLMSDVTIGATHDISDKVLRTIGKMGIDVILFTGCTAHKTSFRNVNLSGVLTSGNEILVYDCSIGNLENFRGIMSTVSFSQGSEIILDGWANIIQGSAGGEPTNEVEINIGTASLNMSHWTGNLKLTGKTGTDRTVINCDSGNIIIDSTCVAGTIQILGTAIIEADNSGAGCTVDLDGLQSAENIAGLVWDELSNEHIAAGSFGELMASLIKLTGYKVTKSGDIITIYESNGITVWRQYDLANGGRVLV